MKRRQFTSFAKTTTQRMNASLKTLAAQVRNMSRKVVYPAPERNKPHILKVLQRHFDGNKPGNVLEISSGTGQHVVHFAQHFPNLTFQPSEYDESLLDSIDAYIADSPTKNIRKPIKVDASSDCKMWDLHVRKFDYLININMMHVSPYICTVGLFENAAKLLKPDGLMVTYGAYAFNGVIEPQSNIDFNRSIRSQNPQWGLRDFADLKKLAEKNGLKFVQKYDLPANNKCLIWQNMNN